MSAGSGKASVYLKARPTEAQIADRAAPPLPDGIEFYLDASDISRSGWLDHLAHLVDTTCPRTWQSVVEGPLRSLDGEFFDATKLSDANREVLDRLSAFGARIGARAAVIHAMAARPSADGFDAGTRVAALESAASLFSHYCRICHRAGMVPTVENVPPVARMREGSFMYSLIGTAPADILWLVHRVPGLRVTLDVSHAQLYVNARNADPATVPDALRPMVGSIQAQPGVTSLDEYIDCVGPHVFEAHISNAAGLLGEGLPYGEGDLDLDHFTRRLAALGAVLVTETLETDADRATCMREAQQRIIAALARKDGNA